MFSDETKFCPNCGHVGRPDSHTPGSILIELVLWICLIVPGLVYSLWRISARRPVCSQCGAANLMPANAPMAKAMMERHGLARPAAARAEPPRPPSAAAYKTGEVMGRLVRGKRR